MRVVNKVLTTMSAQFTSAARSAVTGLAPGPFGVGVTTVQLEDRCRVESQTGLARRLQTEIWYPAHVEDGAPVNAFRDFLGGGGAPEIVAAADAADAIGGYADGTSVASLDGAAAWPNAAVRDARPVRTPHRFPLVVFSHGSGAYRASYLYWTECLASFGFVVAACDHPGSARFTVLDGVAVTPGGARSKRGQMEADRVVDIETVLNGLEKLSATDSRFRNVDARNAAVTGMSFGGWTAAAYAERRDPRVRAVVLQCPSLSSSGGGALGASHDSATPALVMAGAEDTVIGAAGNDACAAYVASHAGPAFYLTLKRGGHCSFTSCDMYDPKYGNGVGTSASLAEPGSTYEPLAIADQHGIINEYGLAFLNAHLKPPGHPLHDASDEHAAPYLEKNHFDPAEVAWVAAP